MPKRFSELEKQKALEFYQNGVEINLICSAIQCSSATLADWRKEAGIKPRMSWRQHQGMMRADENHSVA